MNNPFSYSVNLKILLVVATITVLSGCSEPRRLSLLFAHSKILSFGDSLTYGTGAGKDHSYPNALAKLTGLAVINAGIPGELSSKGLTRLPKLLKQHQPALLVLCHGGNDLLRKKDPKLLKQNLIAMIELSRQHDVEVVIIGVPEAKIFGGIHPVYREVAEALNVPFESEALNSLLKNNKFKSDAVHLNKAGYHKLADSIFQLLQREGAL